MWLVAGGDRVSFELRIAPPFNLELTLQYDQGHRWRPDREDRGWYTSVLGKDFVRIRQEAVDGPLEYEARTQEMAKTLRWQFRADDNIGAMYGKLADDPRMAELIKRYYGLRIMRVDPWECLVFFILSAHNHSQSHIATAPTANAMDEIARSFWKGGRRQRGRYPFPSPKDIGTQTDLNILNELWSERAIGPHLNDIAPARLGGLKDMPERIHGAAQFAAAGGLGELKGRPTDEVISALDELPGVGAKTAHCVALFGLGCLDAFPMDAHVTRALLSLYGRDPFQPIAGYASQFLFMEGLMNSSRQKWSESF